MNQQTLDLNPNPSPLDIVRANSDQFRADFTGWLSENHHIWQAFQREADKVWLRGRRHYSARTIIHYLRHETAMMDSGVEFKINNNASPDMSRLYALLHPDRADLFETRVMPGSARSS